MIALSASGPLAAAAPAPLSDEDAVLLDQGWTADQQQAFYTTSQGSRLIKLAWLRALGRPDSPDLFFADKLARYGYLPNPSLAGNPDRLPIGFATDGTGPDRLVGLTCAACHTGQVSVKGTNYRVDGGPTKADFGAFVGDLAKAARWTLSDATAFDAFAHRVLGTGWSPALAASLRTSFAAWTDEYAGFMEAALPPAGTWGPGRLDAFGMIFDRLAGLDLKIHENIAVADAPVRYPFLWDASRQDKTQWNGAVPNGLYTLGLVRNSGEVIGVFGKFAPQTAKLFQDPLEFAALRISGNTALYNRGSSIIYRNLQKLEQLIVALKPPKWPIEWGLDPNKVAAGALIYQSQKCGDCHGTPPSRVAVAPPTNIPAGKFAGTWATPILPVGTDAKMYDNALNGRSNPGVLVGNAEPPFVGSRLTNPATNVDLLGTAVTGALLQSLIGWNQSPADTKAIKDAVALDIKTLIKGGSTDTTDTLTVASRLAKGGFGASEAAATVTNSLPAYESRVLTGIWAAAPYLHNGSVPTLYDLLLPSGQRPASFMVGSRDFDPVKVGFVTDHSPYNYTLKTDGACAGPTAGDSHCGHDYGTSLSDDERWALIEYLKTL